METPVVHTVLALACVSLRRYAEAIQKNLETAAQGEDIEPIHQVRVACRRLRTALRLFADCLQEDSVFKWRKECKRLLKDLRKARDLDIQIQFLEDLLKKTIRDKKILPGIKRLLLRLRQKRQRLQKRIRKSADRFRKQNILKEIALETEQLERMQTSAAEAGGLSVAERAGTAVREAIEKTTALLDRLNDKKDIKGHHQLRIAVKRLRYTLETFQPAFKEDFDKLIQPLKKMQTLLGDLNDCAVWLEQIEKFSAKEKERTEEYFGHARPFLRLQPGIEYVRRNRKKQWQTLFREVFAYCRKLETDGFWKQMTKTFAAPEAAFPQENHGPSSP
ncbi:MAG TPA: CHAD domain-containing protein [Anaerohalosphaeraceae bacterium]|nr:CHAD domain-containing protein [Anaerohalosphaeraceae bacterium]HOL89064.1 CHAD domain-containing protein [Anaerohalosphaeraceae bacterium]HPP55877.1 CHAD domain-containing protein [Anaerohalosphaeraceae bacterium]